MKTVIVYYSLTGNTAFAAKVLGKALDAELLRIEPVTDYPNKGFRKFFHGGRSAVAAETPALKPYSFSPAAWDRVIIGFPVWAGNLTPPIRTFLKENDLQGKKIAAFACESGAGAEKALDKLLACLGLEHLEAAMILVDPKDKPSPAKIRQIRAFAEGLRGAN